MTMLETAAHTAQHGKSIDYFDLMVTVIRESPKGNEKEWLREFIALIRKEDYEDYLLDAIRRAWGLGFTRAHAAAIPIARAKLNRQADARRAFADKTTAKAEAVVLSRILDMPTPLDKPLGDCTGAECAKLGGFYRKIGSAIDGKDIVRKKLTEAALVKMLKAA